MLIDIAFLTIMFMVYNFLIFELVSRFLAAPRIHQLFRIPLTIINTVVAAALTLTTEVSAVTVYLLIAILMSCEFALLFKDRLSRCLFCMTACLMHIMAMRSICVATFATVLNTSLFAVVDDTYLIVSSTSVTFALLNIAVLLVMKFVPTSGVRIISQHDDQLRFMTFFMGLFCTYLLINATVYSSPETHPDLIANQIVAPIVIMIGCYTALFYSMKTSEALGYKEKSEALEHAVEKERQYRSWIDRDVFRVIEANFSRNELLSGFEDYEDKLGDIVHYYTDMLAFMIRTAVHPEDRAEFTRYSSPLTVVEAFESGRSEISFDYRRLMPNGTYEWMQVLMAMMRDSEIDDVKGFIQIKNINEIKSHQISLQYKAERDQLTGLYNKATTEELIASYLKTPDANGVVGTLFIVDIDNFKDVNDSLGHLYGDAVLSDLSESLRVIFREDDIVGRIGGDEFMVFTRNCISSSVILTRAQEVCNAFMRTYTNDHGVGCTVSSSVGIATFPNDGHNFEELYKNADSALYTAKANGKNHFAFYDKESALPCVAARTAIDSRSGMQKSFKDNRIEYVFRLLYGSDDTMHAIESTLELIANNFGFSRANIFEFNAPRTLFTAVFEWCANGIESVSGNYVDVPIASFDAVVSQLEKSNGMFMAAASEFPPDVQHNYALMGIRSIVHFSIKERDVLIGVIAFQDCSATSFALTEAEFEELRTICQILSTFMSKHLSRNREQRHHESIEAIMNNLNSIAYVIDSDNYSVYYENQNTIDITGHSSIGALCYKAYRGFDAPCADCPMQHLVGGLRTCTIEVYNDKFDLYTKTTASRINWHTDNKAVLMSSVDITEYRKASNDPPTITATNS